MLNSADAVGLGLRSAAENQGGAENSVSEGDENAQTLSLQAPELKEKDPSATEARPLSASSKQVQKELGVPKTDNRMKRLEKENRRLRKILKNPTEERGKQLDEEFEPPSMQDALCQKNYMRRIKRQSRKMEDFIKNLIAAPRNRTRDPDSTATGEGNSPATGEGESPLTSDGECTATSEGDSKSTADCTRLKYRSPRIPHLVLLYLFWCSIISFYYFL
ncbi:uncharacterized protein LOC111864801 [Cryptotermes secundus]|uniref:uncharacterized protein LOC111864801 n=1 Tax=Cryptotermes secundus TaxID=105785 RepID=UPI000CD7DB34|nr:uncharacterized protein LOC111864801 [Cryptotermes secundus]